MDAAFGDDTVESSNRLSNDLPILLAFDVVTSKKRNKGKAYSVRNYRRTEIQQRACCTANRCSPIICV
jgi:hypothetical protein